VSADLDEVLPPFVLFCAECDGRPFAVTETMHDAEAEMAIHYATHGRYGTFKRPAVISAILEREIAEGLA
jgi:hypothetical protein